MKKHDLQQGTAAWHAHRAQSLNASDAPAALGCSPYTTRADLLRRVHTGLTPEVDAGTQRRFDDGHRFEALARPLAEEIIGDDLAPLVGSIEVDGLSRALSASFDGITFMGDTVFEHKSLNADLRACMKDQGNGYSLPKHYQLQMEQQLLVSGAERALFMASEWTGDGVLVEERHCWYASDPALRRELLAGWAQFERDLAAYNPPAAAAPKVVAEPVEALPAVTVQVSGELVLRDNFKAFEVALRDFLEHRLIREPKTDQDFADLDVQIKAMKGAEAALESAEGQMLAQIQTVDQAKKTKDMLARLVRDNRLMAEKLLASEKERRRGEIVAGGIGALKAHIDGLNKRLGRPYMPATASAADFGTAIKGLKSLASMEDKIATALANAKIAANETADRIQANLTALRELAAEHAFLFADAAQLVLKAPDDCRAVIESRIAAHREQEEKRLAAERERIRAEEEAKARAAAAREQAEREAAQRRQREEAEAAEREQQRQSLGMTQPAAYRDLPATAGYQPLTQAEPPSTVVPMPPRAPAAPSAPPTLKLGELNARIAPLSIDAAGLAALGFPHAATDKSAKLFHEHDFPRICSALIAHLTDCQQRKAA